MSQKKIRLAVDLTVEPNNADLDALKQRLLGVMATARADIPLLAMHARVALKRRMASRSSSGDSRG